jgi:Zn-dependent protease
MTSTTPEQIAPAPPKRSNFRRIASGALLAIGVVLLKLKAVLLVLIEQGRLLFVNPFEGFGAWQFAVAGSSAIVTIVAYAMKTEFRLGVIIGFVVVTVIHEIGHAVVIRRKGLRAGWMVFIPFVGGAVTLKEQPRSVYDDAQIGLAGPLAGTFASLVALQIFKWTDNPLYLTIALLGFILNLLNLVPLGMLDGGRISAAISKWMWLIGGAALTYKTVTHPNVLLVLILLLSLFQVYASIMREKGEEFYRVSGTQRGAVAVAYFSLVIFLGHQTLMAFDRLEVIAKLGAIAK